MSSHAAFNHQSCIYEDLNTKRQTVYNFFYLSSVTIFVLVKVTVDYVLMLAILDASPSQETVHMLIHTYGQLSITSPPDMHAFGQCKESGELKGIQHKENMQTQTVTSV